MFGYVIPGLEALPEGERARYQAVYCGLCRALSDRYGQACRFTLSYDMAFLTLVLGSLYEPPERTGAARCPAHPVQPQAWARTEFTDYAADVGIALAYYKCLDDWHDDRSQKARAAARLLKGPYRRARERQPRACAAIEDAMREVSAIERAARAGGSAAADVPADAAANRFGALLGDLFACRDDFWAADLRRFGAHLGKLVYAMDAAVDFDDDAASGSYNPFVTLGASPTARRESLQVLAANAAEAFERLPLERDLHVLRSVIYQGIWNNLNAKEAKQGEHERPTPAAGADAKEAGRG